MAGLPETAAARHVSGSSRALVLAAAAAGGFWACWGALLQRTAMKAAARQGSEISIVLVLAEGGGDCLLGGLLGELLLL